MNCTATLKPQTVTDRTVAHMPRDGVGTTPLYDNLIPDGVTVQRRGDRLVRVDIHTLTCMTPRGKHKTYTFAGEVYEMHQPLETRSGGLWGDDWPGATPHADPTVTDAEVYAACCSFAEQGFPYGIPGDVMEEALEAAARARQENSAERGTGWNEPDSLAQQAVDLADENRRLRVALAAARQENT